jgi:tRNA (guanine-N7-)-methyltransferase
MTLAQQRAIEQLWPRFGIDYSQAQLDIETLFGRRAPCVLEIGFGNGESLVEQASTDPQFDYIGVEVHEPGIGHCLLKMQEARIGNLRLCRHDALEVLQHQVPNGALSRINLYFPDPWPKKRHHKRRIVQDLFFDLAADKLRASGDLCIATDWENYAEHIDEVIARSSQFLQIERRQHRGEQPLLRPTTKFERRGLLKGHKIWDWQLTRL